jgi:polar amino acid transport system substrate-binding protein
MKYYFYSIILSLPLLPDLTLANEQDLRTSYYHRQNVAPQLFFDDKHRPTSGILYDISHAIAKQLGVKLEMLPIPRKRIEQNLLKNIVDMNCAANPKWYKSQDLQWSLPIYQNPDLLINNKGITSLTDLINYQQLKIGTTLGYIYPEIRFYLDNGNILPIASMSPFESYKKYRKNNTSGFIIPTIEFSYLFKGISDSVVTLNNNDISCVFSPRMEKSRVQRINQAIADLKSSGEIKAILNRYKYFPTPQ